jgi:hypothetical protein
MQSSPPRERVVRTKFRTTRYLHQRSEGVTRRASTFERKIKQ